MKHSSSFPQSSGLSAPSPSVSLWAHATHSFFFHRFLSGWIHAQITPPTSVRHPNRSRSSLHALASGGLDAIQTP